MEKLDSKAFVSRVLNGSFLLESANFNLVLRVAVSAKTSKRYMALGFLSDCGFTPISFSRDEIARHLGIPVHCLVFSADSLECGDYLLADLVACS